MSELPPDLQWMLAFVHAKPGEADRAGSWTAAPWSATLNGEHWTGVTTGHLLVVVRRHTEFPAARGNVRPVIEERQTLREYPIALPEFRAWCREGIPDAFPECEECEGEGKVGCVTCEDSGEHKCKCGDVHTCGDCAGTGAVECGECRGQRIVMPPGIGYATLYGVPVDRLKLAPLVHLPGDVATLRVCRPDQRIAIQLVTPDWRLVVMPLHSAGAARVPAWPRVEEVAHA